MSLLQQVRDVLGARRAIEGTILRPAPGEERLEIDRDFAHNPAPQLVRIPASIRIGSHRPATAERTE